MSKGICVLKRLHWTGRSAKSEGAGHLHVAGERWHDVDVEAGHLVQAVEHHRVLPGKDCNGNRTVADGKLSNEYQNQEETRPECKVGFEPGRSKTGGWREEESLRDDRDLHEIAEVEHEEMVVDRSIGRVSQKHQQYQGNLRKSM